VGAACACVIVSACVDHSVGSPTHLVTHPFEARGDVVIANTRPGRGPRRLRSLAASWSSGPARSRAAPGPLPAQVRADPSTRRRRAASHKCLPPGRAASNGWARSVTSVVQVADQLRRGSCGGAGHRPGTSAASAPCPHLGRRATHVRVEPYPRGPALAASRPTARSTGRCGRRPAVRTWDTAHDRPITDGPETIETSFERQLRATFVRQAVGCQWPELLEGFSRVDVDRTDPGPDVCGVRVTEALQSRQRLVPHLPRRRVVAVGEVHVTEAGLGRCRLV